MNGAADSTGHCDWLPCDKSAGMLAQGNSDARPCSVKLHHWPEGLTIPAQFRDRFYFDAAHSRLVFRGLMYKSDYDVLRALSPDTAYLHALEELFCKSAYGSVAI